MDCVFDKYFSGYKNMRKILVTNDDGIGSDGIRRLAQAAKEFGEVWVIAPDGQRSAASHSITLHSPIDICPYDFPVEGVHAWACSGTPGDCVRVGSLYVMPERPDVVLSGINYGYNAATDIQYSATVGAAFEAQFLGYQGIALSEGAHGVHEVTDAYLLPVLRELIGKPAPKDSVWNVNFPACPLEQCAGLARERAVSHGTFYHDRYVELEKLDGGGVRVMVEGIYNEDAEEGTDFWAIVHHYVSIGTVRNVG